MMKLKEKGCYIHDHTDHTLAKCQRMQSLCKEHNCEDSLTSSISKMGSTHSSGSSLKAKRAKAKFKKDQDAMTAEREEMKRERTAFVKKMKVGNELMKALKVLMQVQALAGPSTPVESENPFEALMDTDDEDESIAEDEEIDENNNEIDVEDNDNSSVAP